MAIERQDTANRILTLVAEQLNIDKSNIKEEQTLTSLGADSLDRVEIVMKLEEEFSIEIDDEMAEKIATIGQAIDYVHSLRK